MSKNGEMPLWIHDPNWMVYRVLKRDNVIGEDPESGKTVTSALLLNWPNLFEAIFHGYSHVAIYEVEEATLNGHAPIVNFITDIARVD